MQRNVEKFRYMQICPHDLHDFHDIYDLHDTRECNFDILEPPAFRKYMKNLNILEKWVRIYTRPIAVTAGINQTKEDT